MQSGSRNRARGADVAFGGFRHQELRHFCNFSGPAWPMGTPPADSASWGGGMRRGARSCARALGVGSCACNPWSLFSARSQRYASRIAPSREHQRSQRGRIDINRPCPGFRQATGARGTLRRPRTAIARKTHNPTLRTFFLHGPRAAGFANYQLLPLESTEGRDVSHHCSAVMLLSRRVGSGTPACATLFWPRLTRNVSHSNNVAPGRGTRPARPTGPRKLSPPSTPLDLASSRPSGRGLR